MRAMKKTSRGALVALVISTALFLSPGTAIAATENESPITALQSATATDPITVSLDKSSVNVGDSLIATWSIPTDSGLTVKYLEFDVEIADGPLLFARDWKFIPLPADGTSPDNDTVSITVPNTGNRISFMVTAADENGNYSRYSSERITVNDFSAGSYADWGTITDSRDGSYGQGYFSDGAIHQGWFVVGDDRYYANDQGFIQYDWQFINGHWYYFAVHGEMTTGWLQFGATRYYLNPDGTMATGWNNIGGLWYYMNASGVTQTGWLQSGGYWYYLNTSGAMQTGWVHVGSTWYYLNPNGAMQTGWLSQAGTWYYLNAGGAMATGWTHVGGYWYYMTSSGAMQTGWLGVGGSWYYLNPSGAMATGRQWVDGRISTFNASGQWIG